MNKQEDHEPRHGPIGSAKILLESVVGLFSKRFELVTVELQEEKYRLIDQLLRGIAIGVLGLMSLMMLSFLIIVVCWDTAARLYVIMGLAVVYGLGAWRVYSKLKQRLETDTSPFSATVEELKKDAKWFQKRD
jgi:uncharacterized membrane protein YqjE